MRKLLGWERYDSRAAVEAINAVYRQELRWWMNLYLPSVKLVKKVRVGSKLRRVYGPAQTPWERVLASGQADGRRVAELKKLRSTLDPFALAQSIDRKLECIYALTNRRLSPKAANLCGATAVEKPRGGMSSRQGCESCEVKVLVPPIACSRADSISDACGGDEARSART